MAKTNTVPAPKNDEAGKADNSSEENKTKRVNIRFFASDGKTNFAAPPAECAGIAIIHTPDQDHASGKDMPAHKLGLKTADLKKFPDLLIQLALFGASVHLRNAINTTRDEKEAREALEERLKGFKEGVYRASGPARESVPQVVLAYKAALVSAGTFEEKVIEDKVAAKLKEWQEADKKGKVAFRERLMSNAAVREEFAKLHAPKEDKPAAALADL